VKGHVYNLITNEYLGEPREFTARIPAEGFALFAVTPARVNPPSAEARFSDNGGSQKRIICRAKIAGQPDGADDLIIQFRLFRPDGSEWRDMAATERLRSGAAEHSFVLPLNAPRGQWRVKVREAVSGLSAESVCSVN
jgi:hypothetical protein